MVVRALCGYLHYPPYQLSRKGAQTGLDPVAVC